MHPVAAAGFAAAAEVYERARPSYPAAAIDWLTERLDLRTGRTVVDLGAGTGKLTRLLVPTGARVIAVEPVREMLAQLEAVVPGTETVSAAAEAVPLPDGTADAVTVAQAFHWFDHARAIPEIHRLLAAGGALALVWNMRDLDDPLQAAVEQVLAPARDAMPVQLENAWREPLASSPLFAPVEIRSFSFEQLFTADDLCERVGSTSFVAAMPAERRASFLESVRRLVDGVDEPFPFRYVTEVHVAEAQ